MNRPFLVLVVLGQQRREDGAARNGRLEKGARVQAHHGLAVAERIEVVGLCLRVHRITPPERHVAIGAEVHLRPLLHARGMRPDQDRRRGERLESARPQRANPALHEARFAGAAPEEGRTDIQEERPCVGKPDLAAEHRAVDRRLPVEPVIEALRAGDDHAFGRHAVQHDGFVTLRVVPHEDAIRQVADDRLAR